MLVYHFSRSLKLKRSHNSLIMTALRHHNATYANDVTSALFDMIMIGDYFQDIVEVYYCDNLIISYETNNFSKMPELYIDQMRKTIHHFLIKNNTFDISFEVFNYHDITLRLIAKDGKKVSFNTISKAIYKDRGNILIEEMYQKMFGFWYTDLYLES